MNTNEIVARLELTLEVVPSSTYRQVSATWTSGDGTTRTIAISAVEADEKEET